MKKSVVRVLAVLLALALVFAGFTASADPVSLALNVEATLDGSTVTVSVRDERGGPAALWPVSLIVDGVTIAEDIYTDDSGTVVFTDMVPEGAASVAVVPMSGEIPGTDISFVGTPYYVLGGDNATSVALSTSETDATTVAPTASVSLDESVTTRVKDDLIGVPCRIDEDGLSLFGLTEEEFSAHAVMWLDTEVYTDMVSDAGASLFLKLHPDPSAVNSAFMVTAKNASEDFRDYNDEQISGFAFSFSIMYQTENAQVELTPPEGLYQIDLPVPESMTLCEKMAVAVCTEEGLTPLVPVIPNAGTVSFTVQRFQTWALLGFSGKTAGIGNLSRTPSLLYLLGIVGGILIIGGILILIFVVFRRNKHRELDKINEAEENETQVLLDPTPIPKRESDESLPSFGKSDPAQNTKDSAVDRSGQPVRANVNVDDLDLDILDARQLSPAEQLRLAAAQMDMTLPSDTAHQSVPVQPVIPVQRTPRPATSPQDLFADLADIDRKRSEEPASPLHPNREEEAEARDSSAPNTKSRPSADLAHSAKSAESAMPDTLLNHSEGQISGSENSAEEDLTVDDLLDEIREAENPAGE